MNLQLYFWNLKALKNDLVKNKLSEAVTFEYFLLGIGVLQFVFLGASLEGLDPLHVTNMSLIATDVFAGVITVCGTLYLYYCNQGSGGANFFQRYFSLGWVVGIRYFVVSMPLAIISLILSYSFFNERMSGVVDVLIVLLFTAGYYWLLGKHMKEVAMCLCEKSASAEATQKQV